MPRTKKPTKQCEKCKEPARARGMCPAHYQEERRRDAGITAREDLGPDPVRVDFMLDGTSHAVLVELAKGREARSAFLRRAVRNQIVLERRSGRPVVL